MAVQRAESAPGQLAAAIAKAHPRAKATTIAGLSPTAEAVHAGLLPDEQKAETLAKLMGQEPGGSETADGAG